MKTLRKKIVRESVGRDLVGAGRFESRSSVAAKIMKKYPTPQSLAAGLNKLAGTLDGKAAAKVAELATKAAATDAASYPSFCSKLAGLSKLWAYLATTAAAATAAAGATYIVKSYIDAGKELDLERNGPLGPTIARTNPQAISFGDQAQRATQNMIGDATTLARKVKAHTPQSVKNLVGADTKNAIRNSKLVKGLKDPARAASELRDMYHSGRDAVVSTIDDWRNKITHNKDKAAADETAKKLVGQYYAGGNYIS